MIENRDEAAASHSPDDEFRFLSGDAARVARSTPLPEVRRESVTMADGRRLSVLSWVPDAPPRFAFVHGVGLNAHGYDPTILALDVPAIAIDLAGHGRSDWRDDASYRPDLLAPDIAQVLAERASEPLVLVGHSLGGMTSILTAAANPGTISHLVVIDITPGMVTQAGASSVFEFIRGKRDFASLDEMVDRAIDFGIGSDRAALMRGVALNSRRRQDGRYEWTHHLAHLDAMPVASADPQPFAPIWQALDAVAAAGVPITLIAATNGIVTADMREEWDARLPDSRVIVIEGPHNLHEAAPVELAEALRKLL